MVILSRNQPRTLNTEIMNPIKSLFSAHAGKLTGLMLFIFCFSFQGVEAQKLEIRVDAGAIDRNQSVVSIYLLIAVDEGVYVIKDEEENESSLQVDANNRGWLMIPDLSSGDHKTYYFDSNKQSQITKSSYEIDQNRITLKSDQRDVLSYYHGTNDPPEEMDESYKRGGYIHPVYTPDGVIVTNHLNPDLHPHHSGIWSAWTNTRFQDRRPDFWNIHNYSGRVDQVGGLQETWSGPIFAGFRSIHHFIDLSATEPVVALNEEWVVRSYSTDGSYHIFDLMVTQSVNSSETLYLPQYRYGGVGFRGHIDWDDPDNGTFLTSDGLGRDGHATRVNWTHIGGESEGSLAGITVMSHPSNFRHPQPVRIHPDEPFFNFAPQQLGEMKIQDGSPYIARYRFIVYDGAPDPDMLDQLWNEYAYPAGVTVLEINP